MKPFSIVIGFIGFDQELQFLFDSSILIQNGHCHIWHLFYSDSFLLQTLDFSRNDLNHGLHIYHTIFDFAAEYSGKAPMEILDLLQSGSISMREEIKKFIVIPLKCLFTIGLALLDYVQLPLKPSFLSTKRG